MLAIPNHFKVERPDAIEHILNVDLRANYAIIGMDGKNPSLSAKQLQPLSYLQRMTEWKIHRVTLAAGALEGVRPLNSLRKLEINYVNITDDDLRALGRQSNVQTLNITGCASITDAGLRHLEGLTDLKDLDVSYCDGVVGTFVAPLKKALPACDIDLELSDRYRK